jgi:hypothetical protein
MKTQATTKMLGNKESKKLGKQVAQLVKWAP